MSIHSYKPEKNDWVVDVVLDGKRTGNILWGSSRELGELLWDNINLMGGNVSNESLNIVQLVEVMNHLEKNPKKKYEIIQYPSY